MRKIFYIIQILGLLTLFAGCNDLIYDDLSDCEQGVNFTFYAQTPCQTGPSYPAEIKQVRVFAFDSKNVLVEVYEDKSAVLAPEYLLKTFFNQLGTFTFVAWGGTDLDSYDFSSFEKNKTTKDQMLVSLKRQSDQFPANAEPLYYGISEPLTIIDRTDEGSFFDLVKFNMQELTNRITFNIQGLSETADYSVTITDDNGVYDFDANFAPDSRFDYITDVYRDQGNLLANFSVMKLAENRNTHLTIKNITTGKVVYEVNLIDDLILYTGDTGMKPPYSLECDHDFIVVIKFIDDPEGDETHIRLEVNVNDWNVINRTVILGLE